MLRPKRKISAKAVAMDVIAGADDSTLMTKYRLAPKKLDMLLKKLLEAEIITENDLTMRELSGAGVLCPKCTAANPSHYKFCGQCGGELSWRCPDCGATSPSSVRSCTRCGAEATEFDATRKHVFVQKTAVPRGGREVIRNRVLRDIRSGFGHNALLSKYGLSPRGLETLSYVFLKSGDITPSQFERITGFRSSLSCQKCSSLNSSQNRFCGNCGHSLGQRSTDSRSALWRDDRSSSDRTVPAREFQRRRTTTYREVALPPDELGFIQEIKKAASNALMPLRRITRSRKNVDKAFFDACGAGQIGKVFRLLNVGAEANGEESALQMYSSKARPQDLRLHPLGIAARNGHDDVVALLLEKGADVNKRGGFDLTTALIETRSTAVAQVLLDHGANVEAADLRGRTALMSAASDGCADLVRLLLSKGSKVNALDAVGDTALMCAAQYSSPRRSYEPQAFSRDYPGVVRVLLEHGADISVTNKDGFTALQLADDYSHQELVDILREAGACEPVAEIDDSVLGIVISVLLTFLDSTGRYSPDVRFDISNARKSVKFTIALLFLSVSMLGRIARVDGSLNHAERSCLRRIVRDSVGKDWLDIAEDIFYDRSSASGDSKAFVAAFEIDVRAFAKLFNNHESSVKTVQDELLLMAMADGPINWLEQYLLDLFSREVRRTKWGGHEGNSDARDYRGHDAVDIASCYATLKCNEADSDEDIRHRYRELIKEFHPDAIQGKGLPEDFIAFANKKFQEIQECYKIVMDYRQQRGS